KVDLRHMPAARMSQVLTDVLERGDLSEERQQIIAAMQHGVTLDGAARIERWQARAAGYPGCLARAIVHKYLALPPWWSVPMMAERGDLPLVYGAFKEATERIFGALLGLNRVYHPGVKWLERTLATLPVVPTDLAGRLKQVFR